MAFISDSDKPKKRRPADPQAAIYRYCNYQERCHSEVRNKLHELGCATPEVENLISELIEKNLLNEERYARSFARGKFRIKGWGKTKIISELRSKKISEYCIAKALTEIDTDDYDTTLGKLAEKKWHLLRTERGAVQRRGKLYRYLAQKGYDSTAILRVLARLESSAG